jgi:hypothetical protein
MSRKFRIFGLPWWVTLLLGGLAYVCRKPLVDLFNGIVNKVKPTDKNPDPKSAQEV